MTNTVEIIKLMAVIVNIFGEYFCSLALEKV